MNKPYYQSLDPSVSRAVQGALHDYLDIMGDHEIRNLYRLVIDEVEKPLFDVIMRHTHGNQSKAAQCLGINRATLRTKLKRHNLA